MPLVVLGLAAAGGAYAGWRTRGAVSGLIPGADLATLLQLLAGAGLAGVAAGWWLTRTS